MCSKLKKVSVDNGCSQLNDLSDKHTGWVFLHELGHHLPFGTLAVVLSVLILSVIEALAPSGIAGLTASSHSHAAGMSTSCCDHTSGMDILFHSFHFVHLLFAVSGVMVTFYRYSQKLLIGVLVGVVSASVFCTLSDVLLPYLAGVVLGVPMDLHICFISELPNILPFLFVGVLNGLVMFYIQDFKTEQNTLRLHFFHTFIGSMASLFYAVSHGFADFHSSFGVFFLLILVAVVLPCTLSDVVVPIFFARMVEKK